jgi:hypothetical protein
MPENIKPETPNENLEKNEPIDNGNEPFESDTQKVVRQHMEDKDHVISHDDIANIRVGMTPPTLDEATAARFKGEDAIESAEDDIVGDENKLEEGKNAKDNRVTPWDTID